MRVDARVHRVTAESHVASAVGVRQSGLIHSTPIPLYKGLSEYRSKVLRTGAIGVTGVPARKEFSQ